jgi:serine/threonine-protein kinase
MSTLRDGPSGLTQLLAEIKRRHVVRFSIGYAAAAFVVLQLAEIVFPAFDIGETGLRILVVAVALLFPPAVVLAWVFDITAEGIKRTEELGDERRPGRLTPRLALLVFTLTIVGGLGLWMTREGLLDPRRARGGGRHAPAAEPALAAYDPSTPIRSLAVLPLANISESGEQDYFSAGMHEELIAQLSQLAGLRVVSRTSVLRFAGTEESIPSIGRELQVDAVIEGSIRRVDEQVRITVQLIHAASDSHLWTQQYDRSLEDILALQAEVALDIAGQVQAELSPEETTLLERTASRDVDPEAQEAYLRGKFEQDKGTPEGYRAAMDHFQEAVGEDPAFAPALAGLAGTRFLLGMTSSAPADSTIERARAEAEHAVEMDSTSAEAREVLTLIRQMVPTSVTAVADPAGATPDVQRAPPVPPVPGSMAFDVSGVPGLDTAWVAAMTQMGRRIEEEMRVHGVDAEHAGRAQRLAGARRLLASGLFSAATEMLSGLVDESPDLDAAWELLARTQMAAGDVQAAVGAVEGWSARGGDDAPDAASVAALRASVAQDGARGYWSWVRDLLDARRAAGTPIVLTDYAAAQAGSGNLEGAIGTLEEALARHERALVSLRSDPVWDALRSDPRFTEIARAGRATGTDRGPRGRSPDRR